MQATYDGPGAAPALAPILPNLPPVTLVPNAPPIATTGWRIAFAAVAAWMTVASSFAQTSPSRPSTTGPAAVPGPSGRESAEPDSSTAAPAFGVLRPEDGTIAPLPPGVTYEDFLAWIAAKRGPGYGINSVTLTVREAGDSPLEIEAEVRIVVHRRNEWVRVALGFDEATLTAFEHDGQGACSFSRQENETAHAWSFDTSGEHTLRLSLLAPVLTRSEESRLALTTPADAAVTNVRLQLPLEADVTAGTGVVRSATVANGRTEVDWVGPGGPLDFAWRPKPVAAALDSLAVETTVVPTVNGKSLQLRANQRIQAKSGQISAVSVRLPDGYSLIDVKGALFRSRREDTSEKGRLVTVQLSEATAGPFALEWQLAAPLTDDGLLTLSGFTLPGVPDSAQTGRILLEQSGAYHIYVPPDGPAEGVKTLEMVEPESAPVAAAYEFRQPFRLGLKVEPVPPEFVVTRNMTVVVAADRLSLDGELDADVAQGELNEVDLVWAADGWSFSPVRGMNITEAPRTAGSDTYRIRVTNPSSRISIPLKASRSGGVNEESTTFPLPQLRGSEPASKVTYAETTLRVRHSVDVTVRAQPDGRGALRLLGDAAVVSLGLPDPPPGERWSVYTATSDVEKIVLQVQRLPLTISAAVRIAVRPQGDRFLAEQRIEYDIDHGSTSELRVRLPAGITDILFTDSAGHPLASSPSRESRGTAPPTVSLELQKPIRGPFGVTALYRLPYSATGGASKLVLPVVRPLDAELHSASLRFSPPSGLEASVADSGWTPVQPVAVGGAPEWSAAGFGDSVSIRLSPRLEGSGRPAVSKLLLRTIIDREGAAHTTADCRLDHPPRYVSLQFADGANPIRYLWRGRAITGEKLQEGPGEAVELDLGPDPAAGTLRFEFNGKAAGAPGFAEAVSIPAFRFGAGLTATETLWQVTLPESQHLFTAPAGYTPQFHWTLTRGLWTRQPTAPFGDLSAWFGGDLSDIGREESAGHRYVFSRLGPPQPLSFALISRSLVVLIGAGAAIVLGYLFVNGLVPYRRIATAALAAAVLLLWALFPDQVQIFLQPAAFGLLLVSVAALAERLLRKRQEGLAQIATPPSAVDFVRILPGENSASAPQAPIGSEEPTVLRPGRSTVEPVVAHGSGPGS